MIKNNWHLYFCEIQKTFYRFNGEIYEKLIQDVWFPVRILQQERKYLNWTDLGPF